jgi:hypothetical protein
MRVPADWARAEMDSLSEVVLRVVPCLAACVSIWTGWEMVRGAVNCLVAWARIPRAPWADFEKVPTDWANALSVMDWDVNLVAVHDLRDSANTCNC